MIVKGIKCRKILLGTPKLCGFLIKGVKSFVSYIAFPKINMIEIFKCPELVLLQLPKYELLEGISKMFPVIENVEEKSYVNKSGKRLSLRTLRISGEKELKAWG